MNRMQKWGGVSALIEAATFIIGIVVMITVLAPSDYGNLETDPLKHVQFVVEHQNLLYAWNIIIYVVFGVFLVVLSLALHDRMKSAYHGLMQIATALGLIWAVLVIASGMVANIGAELVVNLYERSPDHAVSTWLAREFVIDGLGGGNEIVGGLWLALISFAGLKSRGLPKWLNLLGLIVGFAGVATLIPFLGDLGMVFGLGQIIWFVWVGIVLLSSGKVQIPPR